MPADQQSVLTAIEAQVLCLQALTLLLVNSGLLLTGIWHAAISGIDRSLHRIGLCDLRSENLLSASYLVAWRQGHLSADRKGIVGGSRRPQYYESGSVPPHFQTCSHE